MAELLESAFPVGTPEELKKANINPKLNGSCSPVDNDGGIKGCSYYSDCVFAKAHANGAVKAFRDHGPKNVGYSIHLGEWGPERPANEDWMPCHRFMATMWKRMSHANYLRENEPGKQRDDIHIIANEGEVIWIHRQVSANPGSKTQLGLKNEDVKFEIPKHARPSQLMEVQGVAADVIRERELARSGGKVGKVPA